MKKRSESRTEMQYMIKNDNKKMIINEQADDTGTLSKKNDKKERKKKKKRETYGRKKIKDSKMNEESVHV